MHKIYEIGYKGLTADGYHYEIINDRIEKKTCLIRFEDGITMKKSLSCFPNKLVKYMRIRNKDKTYTSVDGYTFKIVEVTYVQLSPHSNLTVDRLIIEFLDDKERRNVGYSTVMGNRLIKDTIYNRYRIGTRGFTSDKEEFEIIASDSLTFTVKYSDETTEIKNKISLAKSKSKQHYGFYRYKENIYLLRKGSFKELIGTSITTTDGHTGIIIEIEKTETKGKNTFTIQFEDEQIEQISCYSTKLTRSSRNKRKSIKVGDVFSNKFNQFYEIIKITEDPNITTLKEQCYVVKFLDTGFIRQTNHVFINAGAVIDTSRTSLREQVIKIGDSYPCIYGQMILLNQNSYGLSMTPCSFKVYLPKQDQEVTINSLGFSTGIFSLPMKNKNRDRYNKIAFSQSELFDYEFNIITQMIVEHGELFLNSIISAYTEGKFNDLSYLDDLRFDAFKAFYNYLVQQETLYKYTKQNLRKGKSA